MLFKYIKFKCFRIVVFTAPLLFLTACLKGQSNFEFKNRFFLNEDSGLDYFFDSEQNIVFSIDESENISSTRKFSDSLYPLGVSKDLFFFRRDNSILIMQGNIFVDSLFLTYRPLKMVFASNKVFVGGTTLNNIYFLDGNTLGIERSEIVGVPVLCSGNDLFVLKDNESSKEDIALELVKVNLENESISRMVKEINDEETFFINDKYVLYMVNEGLKTITYLLDIETKKTLKVNLEIGNDFFIKDIVDNNLELYNSQTKEILYLNFLPR